MPVPIALARWLLLSFGFASIAAHAEPVRYALDPVHTRVMFAVQHAGFSHALGTISGSRGELWFDPDDWSTARVVVEVPLQRADLGDADWNHAVLARNLLDAEGFPVARFVSTRIEPVDASTANVHGELTLRGATREATLTVTLNALKRHPLPPFRRTAGFSATATLLRSDYGIDAWKSVIGDEVELRIEAEAVRDRNGDDAEQTPATETSAPTASPEPEPTP
ncbi:hypothetical protein CSC70_04935 [Pseudoxanthomonas kalamensis DSM 18571]|uniref:YceI family protein n=1 Tax=Pseudoxanthomonas kalamensis TaxID=289483 RepID=UPI001391D37E|nr:YceI family protein [Pseudoxanthomonas kalamensis]KAF1711264.1 hypothetical protein CSC70_04935 [Pseudoxanthomonas kalamensis DSM 18571]